MLLLLCVARKEEEEEGDGITFFFFFVPWSLLLGACCNASSEPRKAPELAELQIGPELATASSELAASKVRAPELAAWSLLQQAPSSEEVRSLLLGACISPELSFLSS